MRRRRGGRTWGCHGGGRTRGRPAHRSGRPARGPVSTWRAWPAPRGSGAVDELPGQGRVAAPRRAVVAERAEVAQARRPGSEVVVLARPLDRAPDGRGALPQPPDGLLGRSGDDGYRLAEVEELDARRELAEHLLAEEGVEVDAPQPALLEGLARHLSRLVVGDDELAVVVELEAGEGAAERQRADVRLELELEPDGPDAGGVLELEVAPHELLGVGEEGHLVVGLEREVGEVGLVAQLLVGPGEAGQRDLERALLRRLAVQQFEGAVHERALGGPRRGRLGQTIDGGELERERTVLERRRLRRRERAGELKDHR